MDDDEVDIIEVDGQLNDHDEGDFIEVDMSGRLRRPPCYLWT